MALTNKAFFEDRIARKKLVAREGRPVRFSKDDVYRSNYEKLCRGTNVKVSLLKRIC